MKNHIPVMYGALITYVGNTLSLCAVFYYMYQRNYWPLGVVIFETVALLANLLSTYLVVREIRRCARY